MSEYEEQQKRLRAQVPKGTAGATELERQGFTDVGTFQPSPPQIPQAPQTSELTKVPTEGVGPSGEPIFDVFAGQEHIQDPNDPRLKGMDIAGLPTGQAPAGFQSKFQQGFQQAKAAGAPELVPEGAQGRAFTTQYASPTQQAPSSPGVDNFLLSNPFAQQSTQQLMDLLSPQSTRDSIKTYMDQLTTDRKELSGLRMELMNNKRIMAGTEQDIRDEIQKSGGLGTNSQIQALALSRNKSLIQRNSELSDLIQSQQDAVSTDTQLLQFEKSMASEQFTQRLGLLNYQQENTKFMFNAVKDTYKTLMDKNPQGLYNSLLADPIQAQRFTSITGMNLDVLKGIGDKQALESQKLQAETSNIGKPASVQEYEYAKTQGYKGTFTQYQNEDANRKAKASGAGALSSSQMNSTINQIAGSFDNEPIVKEFNTISANVNFIKTAGSSPTDDIGRIYAFAKVMDPNSVVREGEYKTVQDYSQALLHNYGLKAKRVFDNAGFLTPEARTFLKDTLQRRLNTSEQQYKQVQSQYQKRIDAVQGGGFNTLTDYTTQFKETKDSVVDITETINANKGENREALINRLIPVFPELGLDEIAKYVYTLIPDKK